MAENNQRPILRRISREEFNRSNRLPRTRRQPRTLTFMPPENGTFTASDLRNVIPPREARAFKIIRVFGGRYIRPDNPEGLGTEGPFSMAEFPGEEEEFSRFEELQVTKVIFDVAP